MFYNHIIIIIIITITITITIIIIIIITEDVRKHLQGLNKIITEFFITWHQIQGTHYYVFSIILGTWQSLSMEGSCNITDS